MRMLELRVVILALLGVSIPRQSTWIWARLACSTHIAYEDNYKVMINEDSYVDIISKIIFEKMDLKIEPHPQLYSATWIDKTAQTVI